MQATCWHTRTFSDRFWPRIWISNAESFRFSVWFQHYPLLSNTLLLAQSFSWEGLPFSELVLLVAMHFVTSSFFVTTSKALVTTRDALATSSVLPNFATRSR